MSSSVPTSPSLNQTDGRERCSMEMRLSILQRHSASAGRCGDCIFLHSMGQAANRDLWSCAFDPREGWPVIESLWTCGGGRA